MELVFDIRKVSTIEEALEQYFQPIKLLYDKMYKCESCKTKVPAIKR